MNNPEPQQPLDVDRADILEERWQRALEWVKCADGVAEVTQDDEARELVALLNNIKRLAVPEPNNSFKVYTLGDGTPISLMPLLTIDEASGDHYVDLMHPDDRAHAHFSAENQYILLKDTWEITLAWRGLILLHEARHARDFLDHPDQVEDEDLYLARERDTFAFEMRLISKLGGERYQEILDQTVGHLRTKLQTDESGHLLEALEIPANSQLDEIFGESLSMQELAARNSLLIMQAVFILYDEKFGPDSDEAKKKFIRVFWQD